MANNMEQIKADCKWLKRSRRKNKMAYNRKSGMGKGSMMTKALGQMVGLLLSLYVFHEIIDSIWTTVNSSTWFSEAVDLVGTLLPVIGILGAFEIIWRALKKTGLM